MVQLCDRELCGPIQMRTILGELLLSEAFCQSGFIIVVQHDWIFGMIWKMGNILHMGLTVIYNIKRAWVFVFFNYWEIICKIWLFGNQNVILLILDYFQLFTGEFSTAIKKSGLHLGLYHSLYEWFNPLYMKDKANNFTTKEFVKVHNILLIDQYITWLWLITARIYVAFVAIKSFLGLYFNQPLKS